jgi:hypothetical protein
MSALETTTVAYLAERGFAPETIERLRWRIAPLGGDARRYGLPNDAARALAWRIPYPARDGRPGFERIRLIDPADLERFGGGKYRQPGGCKLDLYDPAGWLDAAEPYDGLLLIEGEANAAAVAEMAPDLPVVGLPGRRALKDDLAARLGHVPVVWVWIDRDEAGYAEALATICRRLWAAGVDEVRVVPPCGGLDANDVLREGGREDGGGLLWEMLDAAKEAPRVAPDLPGVGAVSAGTFQLLTAEDLVALPDPSWLIDGLVPAEA